jgi:hypothetical protein
MLPTHAIARSVGYLTHIRAGDSPLGEGIHTRVIVVVSRGATSAVFIVTSSDINNSDTTKCRSEYKAFSTILPVSREAQ